jgi:hypothetical protein
MAAASMGTSRKGNEMQSSAEDIDVIVVLRSVNDDDVAKPRT